MDLNEYHKSKRVKLLVYGPPKSGKTALVGMLAKRFKLHWIDLEQGIKTLLNPALFPPEYRSNVNVINIPDHRFNPVGIDTVRSIFRGGAKRICYDHGKVACPLCSKRPEARWSEIDLGKFGDDDLLVIDSFSQLAASALSKVTLKAIMAPNGEDYKATWDDYAAQGALMSEVLSIIQVLDLNIACISHETDSESINPAPGHKGKVVPVAGTRNASRLAAKYFDEVVYCSILNKKHVANNSTVYDPTVMTGGRSGILLDGKKDGELSLLPLFGRD